MVAISSDGFVDPVNLNLFSATAQGITWAYLWKFSCVAVFSH